jgi:hypothetical protein
MKQLLVIALIALTGLHPVWAYLGDGSDRIDDLYGNLVQRQLRDDGTVGVVYHKDRYIYLVVFANGRSISESYSHTKGTELSEKEIAKFLKLNAAGGTWIPANTSKGQRFKRNDNGAEATYGITNGRRALTVRDLRGKRVQRDQ